MNGQSGCYVVRSTDVMDEYLAQMDPDYEDYLQHWSLAGAKTAINNWKERAGHAYQDRIWNPATNAWKYVYDQTAGALSNRSAMKSDLNRIGTLRKFGSSEKANSARTNAINSYQQHSRAYNSTLLGKAERALRNVKARIGNTLSRGVNKAKNMYNRSWLHARKVAKTSDGSNAYSNKYYTEQQIAKQPYSHMSDAMKNATPYKQVTGGYNPNAHKRKTMTKDQKNKAGYMQVHGRYR